MSSNNLTGNMNIERQFDATIQTDAEVASGWVPLKNYEYTLFVGVTGTVGPGDAGSNLHLQWSTDGSASSGNITGASAATDFSSGSFSILLRNGNAPVGATHVRGQVTVVGTANAITCVAIQLGREYIVTATQTNADSDIHPTVEVV